MSNRLPTIDEALDELGIELPRSRKLRCPNGTDKTASLHVYEDGFYCFHCGENGDGLGLIAFFTGQDIRRLMAQRLAGNTDPTRIRAATKGLRTGDVNKAVTIRYRTMHNDWFRWLHETWADAPLWAFEQSLDIWSQAFDDLRDRILGHGVWDEDGPLSPFEADRLIDRFAADLEGQREREVEEAKHRRNDEARAAYWRRKRAFVTNSVYMGA